MTTQISAKPLDKSRPRTDQVRKCGPRAAVVGIGEGVTGAYWGGRKARRAGQRADQPSEGEWDQLG